VRSFRGFVVARACRLDQNLASSMSVLQQDLAYSFVKLLHFGPPSMMENVLHDYNYCYYGKVQIISLYYRLYMGYSRDVPLNHPPSSHLCPIGYIGYYGHLYIPWDPNRTLISPPPQVKSFKGVNLMAFIV